MDYPFESISVNGRDVNVAAIIKGTEKPRTEFEDTTFGFLQNWFRGNEEFHLQTSGSTGTPKRIAVHRWQMEASAEATRRALQLSSGGNSLACLDTRYVAGQMMLVRSLLFGMRVHAIEPTANPLEVVSPDNTFVLSALVPYQLQKIVESDLQNRLSSIDTVIVGGSAVSSEIIRRLDAFSTRIFATYGMTETLSHVALRRLNGPDRSDLFHALPGVTLDVDHRGCLKIEVSYLQRNVITNDLVELVGESAFRWLGRADFVINSGGVKVSPEAVEARLESFKTGLNLHGRFVVSSVPDSELGERIVLVVEGTTLDEDARLELFAAFRKELPRFERPKEIFSIPRFPETATGKIDRLFIRKLLS